MARSLLRQMNGQSAVLDGASGYATIPDANQLDFTSSFSISAWIFPRSLGEGSAGRIIDKSSAYTFRLTTGNALVLTNGAASITSIGSAYMFGDWAHVGVVYDDTANTVQFYVNGLPFGAAQTQNTNPSVNTNAMLIGNNSAGGQSATFNGGIIEPALFNGALTAAEMKELFSNNPARLIADARCVFFGKIDAATATVYQDLTSYANNGTVSNMLVGVIPAPIKPRRIVRGAIGQAVSFNGVSGNIQIPDANQLDFTSSYSFSAWLYIRSLGEGNAGVIYNKNPASGYALSLGTGGSGIFRLNNTGSVVNSPSNYVLLGRWAHYAVVYDDTANTVQYYKNGTPFGAAVTQNTNPTSNASVLRFGNLFNNDTQTFDGLLIEPLFYNNTLTASEVNLLYTRGAIEDSRLVFFGAGLDGVSDYFDLTAYGNAGTITTAVVDTVQTPFAARVAKSNRVATSSRVSI